ncbi:MAG: hypothetical protein NZ530_06895 [Thermodesulfobacteriaceae bacterium]|nr:hypothetical protein [Thermodesulfobacteriaceae bacterium]MDW8136393.1 hypothetical protein [Thermodesulfobacterium sp.]
MKIRYIFLIFWLILFIESLNATSSYEDNNIKFLQKNLIKTKQELENIQETKKKLLKLYINLFIYNNFKEKIMQTDKNQKNLLETLKEYEDRDLFQKFLLNYLIKSLLKKEKELKAKEDLYLSKINKLKQEKLDYNKNNIVKFNFIESPIEGIVKQINFIENKINIVIEGEKCKAYISGIEVLKVNLGDYVKNKDIIGEIFNQKEKPKISIKCN